MTAIAWFRRDLRLGDNPALSTAADHGDVVGVFVLDPAIFDKAGPVRQAYLAQSLRALNESMQGNLHVIKGDAQHVIPELAKKYDAKVFAAADYSPFGRKRDAEFGDLVEWIGSPYAVAPGRVRKGDDTPYRVYTPFYKAWVEHGWRAPMKAPKVSWVKPTEQLFPEASVPEGLILPEVGEAAALKRWAHFKKSALGNYDEGRNFASGDTTSMLSAALRWGEIHPRTLLAELNATKSHEVYRKEIAWREFYADVLFHEPHTATDYYKPNFARMRYNEPGAAFQAWCEGKTGYPFVDAGMRQLLREGWMHNRLRMVVASFLVKDLHIEWQHGARHFMHWLRDGDVASNSHGWQWTAGCGTDAAPYFRIFNPVEQGKRFDPDGEYVRKYVPELSHLNGADVHEPWLFLDGYANDYPERIVDHGVERNEALARLVEIKEG